MLSLKKFGKINDLVEIWEQEHPEKESFMLLIGLVWKIHGLSLETTMELAEELKSAATELNLSFSELQKWYEKTERIVDSELENKRAVHPKHRRE